MSLMDSLFEDLFGLEEDGGELADLYLTVGVLLALAPELLADLMVECGD